MKEDQPSIPKVKVKNFYTSSFYFNFHHFNFSHDNCSLFILFLNSPVVPPSFSLPAPTPNYCSLAGQLVYSSSFSPFSPSPSLCSCLLFVSAIGGPHRIHWVTRWMNSNSCHSSTYHVSKLCASLLSFLPDSWAMRRKVDVWYKVYLLTALVISILFHKDYAAPGNLQQLS